MKNQERPPQKEDLLENIAIPDQEKLDQKIEKFKEGGPDKIHILTDFDGTLNKQFVDGKKIPSIISKLRESDKYISPEYAEKAKKLYAKYHPYEVDPSLSMEEKRNMMLSWWTEHYEILREMGMTKEVLDRLVVQESANLREGMPKFLSEMKKNNIPIIIMSSSGIGDAIPMFLKRDGLLYNNIHVLSNQMIFDKDGKMTGVKEPIIHTMNKNEVTVKELPIYEDLKNRGNVILMGNSLGDLGMIDGFDFDEIIKIGFLNENPEKQREKFEENFDVIITGDGDMGYINELIDKVMAT